VYDIASVLLVVLFIVAYVTCDNIVCTAADVELNNPASPNVVFAWLVANVHCACQLGGFAVSPLVAKDEIEILSDSETNPVSPVAGAVVDVPTAIALIVSVCGEAETKRDNT